MGLLKPESLVWADQIQQLKGQTPSEKRAELKKAYDLSSSQITNLLNINICFDPPAFDKVRQAAQGPNPFILSFSSAKTLTGLKTKAKPEDLSGLVHAALDVILARRLATKDIKKLLAWIISGKPAAEFDPKQKMVKPPKHKDTRENTDAKDVNEGQTDNEHSGKNKPYDLKKLRQMLEKAEAERIRGNETTEQDKLEANIQKIAGSSPSSPAGISVPFFKSKTSGKGPQKASSAEEGLPETIFLDWLADIPVLARIKSKRKKGKSLSAGEWVLLAGHKAGNLFGHLAKFFLKTLKPFLKLLHWAWKLVIDALKELGLYKYAKAILTLAGAAAAVWFGWQAFHYGIMRPVEMVWSRIHREQTAASEPASVPALPPAPTTVRSQETSSVRNSELKTSNSSLRTADSSSPVASYHPSQSWTDQKTAGAPAWTQEDQKVLETEIDSVVSRSVLKDDALHPDETMPVDLAASRLQDLTDPDKYSMKIGRSNEKILSVTPTNINLVIAYKSADALDGIWGGSGQMNFFWEDVKVIHVNEIDIQGKVPTVIYQCSLIVSGAKNPLTIQCTAPDDLEHLVSTMEYFIRHSRLGHDAALAGMPYSFQGLRLADDGVVDKLWAGSPMDKAGVGLGDHLWSIGKAASDRQGKKLLEAGIQSVPVTFYTVSPEEWKKANDAKNQGNNNSFRPKLRKVCLQP